MRMYVCIFLLTISVNAQASNLEFGYGISNDFEFRSSLLENESKRRTWFLGYDASLAEGFSIETALGYSEFSNGVDTHLRIAPRYNFGDLYFTLGVAAHKLTVENEDIDLLNGVAGLGFRTNREPGNMGYGASLTYEQSFYASEYEILGKKAKDTRFENFDVSLFLTYGL